MKKLLLVRAAGLTPDDACRGDVAANLSDLIADGSFAPIASPVDLEGAVKNLGPDRALKSIKVSDIQGLVIFLEKQTRTNKRNGAIRPRYSPGTIGHHLVSLGGLYVRAMSEELTIFTQMFWQVS